jgi:serine/threonine protein kinase
MSSGQVLPEGYRLEQRIGQGGFGEEVWRATDPVGRLVTINIVPGGSGNDPRHRQRRMARQGLETVRRLCHPFLLRTHTFWEDADRLYVVMDLAEASLRDRLRAWQGQGGEGLPAAELVPRLREAAEALDYLHARGVLHRNVHPGNLLLLGGHALLDGFALARHHAHGEEPGTVCGTPAYMAPEAWEGRAGPASDQYALACSWAELRRGRPPFAGVEALTDLMRAHREGVPDLGPLPEGERAVLLRGLAKDPARRFGSCAEFAVALGRACGHPFPAERLDPSWRTSAVPSIARRARDERDWGAMPVLADALEEAGCTDEVLLSHCRSGGEHTVECWALDLVLGPG